MNKLRSSAMAISFLGASLSGCSLTDQGAEKIHNTRPAVAKCDAETELSRIQAEVAIDGTFAADVIRVPNGDDRTFVRAEYSESRGGSDISEPVVARCGNQIVGLVSRSYQTGEVQIEDPRGFTYFVNRNGAQEERTAYPAEIAEIVTTELSVFDQDISSCTTTIETPEGTETRFTCGVPPLFVDNEQNGYAYIP